jgi:hypothetical protein
MAQRKAQRRGQAKSRTRAHGGVSGRGAPKTIAEWQRECERLQTELAAARAEIASLRARQEQVLNRIAWALDSLDSLLQSES